jgi:hypothetical protein
MIFHRFDMQYLPVISIVCGQNDDQKKSMFRRIDGYHPRICLGFVSSGLSAREEDEP